MGYAHHDRRGIKPLWPFGHGLSYTSFELSDLAVSVVKNNTAKVTFTVHNTGDREGSYAPQVYVSAKVKSPAGILPVQRLQAFTKVHLKAGRKELVELQLKKEAFSFYNQVEGQWVITPGEYVVRLAHSSMDIAEEVSVTIGESSTWTGL